MLAASTVEIEKGNKLAVGRKFEWGTCFIRDEQHTEFTALSNLLLKYLREGLVMMTSIKQKEPTQPQTKTEELPSIYGIAVKLAVIAVVIGGVAGAVELVNILHKN
jgi:hypothetical protein